MALAQERQALAAEQRSAAELREADRRHIEDLGNQLRALHAECDERTAACVAARERDWATRAELTEEHKAAIARIEAEYRATQTRHEEESFAHLVEMQSGFRQAMADNARGLGQLREELARCKLQLHECQRELADDGTEEAARATARSQGDHDAAQTAWRPATADPPTAEESSEEKDRRAQPPAWPTEGPMEAHGAGLTREQELVAAAQDRIAADLEQALDANRRQGLRIHDLSRRIEELERSNQSLREGDRISLMDCDTTVNRVRQVFEEKLQHCQAELMRLTANHDRAMQQHLNRCMDTLDQMAKTREGAVWWKHTEPGESEEGIAELRRALEACHADANARAAELQRCWQEWEARQAVDGGRGGSEELFDDSTTTACSQGPDPATGGCQKRWPAGCGRSRCLATTGRAAGSTGRTGGEARSRARGGGRPARTTATATASAEAGAAQ